jgi:hypothetical protein
MKKFKNLKQSILNKNIFKRLRNTINANSSSNASSLSKVPNFTQLNTKKLYDLLDSSSTYVINGTINANTYNTVTATTNQTSGSTETMSTSSLLSKCNFNSNKKEIYVGGKRLDYERLNELDLNNKMIENEDLHQIFFSHYIGYTILSYGMDGSASKFISKIIDTVRKII